MFMTLSAILMWGQSFIIYTTEGEQIGYSNDAVERIEFTVNPLPVNPPVEYLGFKDNFEEMTPAEGIVDLKEVPAGLGRISISMKGTYMANTECKEPLTLTNGDDVVFARKGNDEGMYVYRDMFGNTTEFVIEFVVGGFTTPGNYVLSIPKGFYISVDGKPLGGATRMFMIERPAPAQTFTVTPEEGKVEKIENLEFRFDNYPVVEVNPGAMAYVYREGSSNPVASAVPVVSADGAVTVTPATAVMTPGVYTVSILAGSFTIREEEGGKAYLSDELKAVYEIEGSQLEEPRVGDFYYSDGTWRSTLITGGDVQPIGVVFYVGVNSDAKDNKAYYKVKDGSGEMPEFHGYVVALRDATYYDGTHNPVQWSFYNGWDDGCGCSVDTKDFLGYTNTRSIEQRANDSYGGLSASNENFPATYYATDFFESQVPAPAQSSGWFLPSAGQLQYIWDSAYFAPNGNPDAPSVEKSLKQLADCGGAEMYVRDSCYWSSTEQYDSSACSYRSYYVNFDTSNFKPGFTTWYNKNGQNRVRAILAF